MEINCFCDEKTMMCAAENGHLDILIWLRKNNCPWNGSIYEFAAKNGHSKILKWAIENDCPVDEKNIQML